MIEVIPSINEESFAGVTSKIKLVEPYVKWVHLDVADGTFTPVTLWHDYSNLIDFATTVKIEVHLMIADIDGRFINWILPCVNRIIFHLEASHDAEFVLSKIKKAGKEAGIAIIPETRPERAILYSKRADLIQALAVHPGPAGQVFLPETLEKIKHIRKEAPNCIIEVDGGLNLETGKACIEAGANVLVSANYIFNAPDIKKAIEDLENL